MRVIFQSLDTSHPDYCRLWAACTLTFCRFPYSAKFMVPSLASFCSSWNLKVKGIEVDSATLPTWHACLDKGFKNQPILWRVSCQGSPPLCTVQSMMLHLGCWGNSPGPLFLLQSGQPLTCSVLTFWLHDILSAVGIAGNFSWPVIASRTELLR